MTTDRPVSLAANAAKTPPSTTDHGPLRQWWAANPALAASTSGGPDSAPALAPAASPPPCTYSSSACSSSSSAPPSCSPRLRRRDPRDRSRPDRDAGVAVLAQLLGVSRTTLAMVRDGHLSEVVVIGAVMIGLHVGGELPSGATNTTQASASSAMCVSAPAVSEHPGPVRGDEPAEPVRGM